MYSTPDLYLASYLKASGIRIVEFKKVHRRVYFVFDDSEELRQKKIEFFNDGMISVSKFKNAIQDLKTAIFHGG